VALVLVLATCVALVLAQSAGLIDLPLLGQPGGQAAGGGRSPAVASYSPANRSSSSTSVGPTRLRAST
jgi:hypothetical protein